MHWTSCAVGVSLAALTAWVYRVDAAAGAWALAGSLGVTLTLGLFDLIERLSAHRHGIRPEKGRGPAETVADAVFARLREMREARAARRRTEKGEGE